MSGPWDRARGKARPEAPREDAPRPARDAAAAGASPPPARDRGRELRLYGLNAVRAAFARRPDAIRKVYLLDARIPDLQPLLRHCVVNRIGYRVVAPEELTKLAAGSHHEGVVVDVLREDAIPLATWLPSLAPGAQCLLWLDGVGNPHNLGAILRGAAHFGIAGVLVPADGGIALSGAAARVAEGGAESVPLVQVADEAAAIEQLHRAGFTLAATVVRGGEDVFARALPQRLVFVMGAEAEGMRAPLAAACDLRVSIPGTGAVESLNVASATAVLLAQWRARQGSRAG